MRAAATPTARSPFPFDKLPEEVRHNIVRHCDIKSLVNLRATSTRTRALTEEAVPGVQHVTGPTHKAAVENAISKLAPAPLIARFPKQV